MLYGHDDGERQSKMQSLMDLINQMKELQADGAKPKAAVVEMHEEGEMPIEPSAEEGSLEHEFEESPEEEKVEAEEKPEEEEKEEAVDEEEEVQEEPSRFPEALLKLIAERLHK